MRRALYSLLKSTGIERSVEQSKALLVWEEVVGKSIAKNTEAQEVKHGTLMVKVSTPVWRNEIAMQKKEIIGKLNERIGSPVIKNIRLT
ncbi:MAG: DUF721 domain-containing protein [Fidelibacterota bacterium]